jgi:uncharacterized damage-inducible protein DinB
MGMLWNEQVWERHGEHENAVGNLILHLCRNARQWVIHGVGGEADARARDLEFFTRSGMNGAELMALFVETMAIAKEVIRGVSPQRLVETTRPHDVTVTVLEAIYHVVGHVQLHLGQIVLLTKQMVGRDLDLSISRKREVLPHGPPARRAVTS